MNNHTGGSLPCAVTSHKVILHDLNDTVDTFSKSLLHEVKFMSPKVTLHKVTFSHVTMFQMTHMAKKANFKIITWFYEPQNNLCISLYISGPVASFCNERYGTKVTMFIAGILSALGLLMCSFVTEFYMVLLSLGVLSGRLNNF